MLDRCENLPMTRNVLLGDGTKPLPPSAEKLTHYGVLSKLNVGLEEIGGYVSQPKSQASGRHRINPIRAIGESETRGLVGYAPLLRPVPTTRWKRFTLWVEDKVSHWAWLIRRAWASITRFFH